MAATWHVTFSVAVFLLPIRSPDTAVPPIANELCRRLHSRAAEACDRARIASPHAGGVCTDSEASGRRALAAPSPVPWSNLRFASPRYSHRRSSEQLGRVAWRVDFHFDRKSLTKTRP